ncbi:hypothetical protein Y032_0122g1058 [Ancylostoma ceylanicum]|uniref:aECM cysteine-cradle domain-containing protein n=1 Tax=Ancylostoma ceylanicum TaxID=53326 RepID=A0A016T9X9_9BILA|nr:hypothetical protein Y032_0122g1058 [Ancylostoma ceylanicum]
MINCYVIFIASLVYFSEGLRQIRVGPVSHSATVSPVGFVQDNFDPSSFVQEREDASGFKENLAPFIYVKETPQIADNGGSVQPLEAAPNASEEDIRIVPKTPKRKKKRKKGKKKRKMRKVNVKPRGGRHIKDTFQDLRPWNTQYLEEEKSRIETTTETVVTFEPIYDKSSGTSYSQEELLKLCEETKNIGAKFGIYDISSFAGSNCALIRLYYPEVTCEQINVFLQYCQSSGSIQ